MEYPKVLFWVHSCFKYVNDVSQAVKCHLFLYADESCLVCQHKDPKEIEKQLNAKSIFFVSKFRNKNIKKLNIKYRDIQIKQHSKVKHLGRLMDETMSGEAMTLYVIHKINNKLKFLYRKNDFLTPNTETPSL